MFIGMITLDELTKDSVSVKSQQVINHEGQQYPIGQPHRKAYANTVHGRQKVEEELPEAQRNAIFAVWGNAPTVNEIELESTP